MTRHALWLPALLVVLLGAPAVAYAEVDYGPVPASLYTAEPPTGFLERAKRAIEALETGTDADARLDARALLVVMRDEGGLLAVAERLAAGDTPPALLPHLLHVIVASDDPAAVVLLSRAATENRPDLRAMAADGLGRAQSDEAVRRLAELAVDPVPSVRAAALRALFAIDTDAAVSARQALPVDPRTDLHARRLRWHYLRGQSNPSLRPMALETFRRGRDPLARLWAMRLLAHPSVEADLPTLEAIIDEMGTDALGAAMTRLARRVPRRGYDPLESRLAAVVAAYTALRYAGEDEALRKRLVARLVGWLARPVRVRPGDDGPSPTSVLRLALPDQGEAVVEPTLALLLGDRFHDPLDGVDLLTEALAPDRLLEMLRGLVDPDAATPAPTGVRVAAAGALRVAGRIGSEALARRLVRPEEEAVIRRDAVRALAGDDGAWAILLLAELAAAEDPTTSPDAVRTLEEREDPEARRVLVAHLFERARHPEVRLEHLVAPADDLAFEVLERALKSDRASLRRAALRQLHQVRALGGDRALALLRAHEPKGKRGPARTNELQQMLYAWFALAPLEGIRWARSQWAEFQALDWEGTALRSLQNAQGETFDRAIIDLVLEKVRDGAHDVESDLLVEAATALEGRTGYRDDDLDAFYRRLLTHPDPKVVWGAVYSLEHPGRGNLMDLLVPLFEGLDTADPDDFDEISVLLEVLDHQPWAKVEPLLETLVFDRKANPDLRRLAAVLLNGRVSSALRNRLVAWLTDEQAEDHHPAIAEVVARVVGTDGDEAVAKACYDALAARLERAFEMSRELRGDGIRRATGSNESRRVDEGWLAEPEQAAPLTACARAIAYTEHTPTIEAVVRLLFDERLARYARREIERQGGRLGPVDATACAGRGPGLRWVWHRHDTRHVPAPWEITMILDALKPAADDVLAQAVRRAMEPMLRGGGLEAFPDLYMDRLIAALRERSTGDRESAALMLESGAFVTEPVGGATEYGLRVADIERSERWGNYARAAQSAREALHILARRAYDDDRDPVWRHARATLDAWRGAVRAAAGEAEQAETLFRGAVRWNPYDSRILQTVARARARTKQDLDEALALAQRAFVLDRRVRYEHNFEGADTLALVHLTREEYGEAADAIGPMLRRAEQMRWPGGRYHLRYAEAQAQAGEIRDAAEALFTALGLEPSLAEAMKTDPYLEPLREGGQLETVLRLAEETALREMGQ